MDNRNSQYRTMLTTISDEITDDELQKMKFYCKDYIKATQRDKITTPVMLWSKLEECKKLGPDNLTFLGDFLRVCTEEKASVMDVYNGYADGADIEMMDARPENQHSRRAYRGPDFKREIKFLVDHLAKDWRFFVRSLGLQEEDIDLVVANHPRDVREQISQAIWIWLYKEQENAKKDHFANALLDIRRRDLAHKLHTNDY